MSMGAIQVEPVLVGGSQMLCHELVDRARQLLARLLDLAAALFELIGVRHAASPSVVSARPSFLTRSDKPAKPNRRRRL